MQKLEYDYSRESATRQTTRYERIAIAVSRGLLVTSKVDLSLLFQYASAHGYSYFT